MKHLSQHNAINNLLVSRVGMFQTFVGVSNSFRAPS